MLLRIAITMGVASFVATSAPAMMQHDNVFRGAVTRILDGDTFEVRGHRRRIMLSGTDAPEPGEKGYSRSRETLRSLSVVSRSHADRLRSTNMAELSRGAGIQRGEK